MIALITQADLTGAVAVIGAVFSVLMFVAGVWLGRRL